MSTNGLSQASGLPVGANSPDKKRGKEQKKRIFAKILFDGKLGNLVYMNNPRGFGLPRGVCEEL